MRARAVTPAARAVVDRRRDRGPHLRRRRVIAGLAWDSTPSTAGHIRCNSALRKERVMRSSTNLLWGGIVGAFGVALGIAAGCQSGAKESSRDIPAGPQTQAELGIYKWHLVVDDGYGFELTGLDRNGAQRVGTGML